MHVTPTLFMKLKDKKIQITCKAFGGMAAHKFEGTVIGDASTGLDSFLELDTGELINTKFIESIKILEYKL